VSGDIDETERVAAHLAGCFDELYRSLGECAPGIADDGACVFSFELARQCGRLRDRFDDLAAHRAGTEPLAPVPVPAISGCVARAVREDPSGALLLYGLSMVIGPRLLVSLRDATMLAGDAAGGPLRAAIEAASSTVISSSHEIAELTRRRGPVEEDVFRAGARSLEDAVERAGYAESFGTGVAG
jgi:hypothetical protein